MCGVGIPEAEREVVKDRAKRHVTANLWKALHASLYEGQRRIVSDKHMFPILDEKKFKKDIISEMPSELVDLSWTCRKPKKGGTECLQCHACKTRAAAMKGEVLKSAPK